MTQIEDIITSARGLQAALDRLWRAREAGYKPTRAELLRLEKVLEDCAMHEAVSGL